MPFVKGQVANPKGRPKGGFSIDQLYKAIRRQEKQEGRQKFLDHVITQAYKDNKVLIAVLKKIVPDLIDNGNGAAVETLLSGILKRRQELQQAASHYIDVGDGVGDKTTENDKQA